MGKVLRFPLVIDLERPRLSSEQPADVIVLSAVRADRQAAAIHAWYSFWIGCWMAWYLPG